MTVFLLTVLILIFLFPIHTFHQLFFLQSSFILIVLRRSNYDVFYFSFSSSAFFSTLSFIPSSKSNHFNYSSIFPTKFGPTCLDLFFQNHWNIFIDSNTLVLIWPILKSSLLMSFFIQSCTVCLTVEINQVWDKSKT